MIYRRDEERKKFGRQLVVIAIASGIVCLGLYTLRFSDAPYHPEVTRGEIDLISLD